MKGDEVDWRMHYQFLSSAYDALPSELLGKVLGHTIGLKNWFHSHDEETQ